MSTITEEKTITTRALYRELPRIARAASKGERFAVTKNGKPMFSIGPVRTTQGKSYTLSDFKDIQWSGDDPDLSKKTDEIVYGA